MFFFLVEALNIATRLTQHLKVEQDSRLQHLVVSLYLTILDQAFSAASLIRDNRRAGVDIILRSSLEAYVDLINLTADADYYDSMLASYHREWIKLAGGGSTNPYLEKFLGNAEFATVLQMHRDALAQLERNTPPLSVRKRFESWKK